MKHKTNKILLFTVPWSYKEMSSGVLPFPWGQGIVAPLGLLYMAAELKRKGYSTKVMDGFFEKENKIFRFLADWQPDIIGISIFSCMWNKAKIMIAKIKSLYPGVIIVAGGPHITSAHEKCVQECPAIDFAVPGEAEGAIAGIIDEILENREGRSGREKIIFPDKLRQNQGDFLMPDRACVNSYNYIPSPVFIGRQPFANMITSRGCAKKCAFCDISGKRGVRFRDPDNIISELLLLVEKFGVRAVNFCDDFNIFNYNNESAHKVCDALIAKELDLKWASYLLNFNIDKELLRKMKKAGCYRLVCLIDSAVPKNRSFLWKENISVQNIDDTIAGIKSSGIESWGRFVLGIPQETEDEALYSISYAVKSELDFAYFIKPLFLPYSELFNRFMRKEGVENTTDMWNYYAASFESDLIPREELKKLLFKAYLKFYALPKRLPNFLKLSWRFKAYLKWQMDFCLKNNYSSS